MAPAYTCETQWIRFLWQNKTWLLHTFMKLSELLFLHYNFWLQARYMETSALSRSLYRTRISVITSADFQLISTPPPPAHTPIHPQIHADIKNKLKNMFKKYTSVNISNWKISVWNQNQPHGVKRWNGICIMCTYIHSQALARTQEQLKPQ